MPFFLISIYYEIRYSTTILSGGIFKIFSTLFAMAYYETSATLRILMNNRQQISRGNRQRPVEILYEDRDIIVVNKASGILTIATDRERGKTAYHILTDYVRKGYSKSRNRIFIVHRLDRDTSGILVIAKNQESKVNLQSNWDKTEKKYITVVHGNPEKKTDTITSYLTENKAFRVYSTSNHSTGRLSRTSYRVLEESGRLSLLEIDLLTGRKHQIRVHLSESGYPVVGDKKYGNTKDGYERLALHARSISFRHPYTGKQTTFEAPVPPYFSWIMRKKA